MSANPAREGTTRAQSSSGPRTDPQGASNDHNGLKLSPPAAPAETAGAIEPSYLNRDISWLEFNRRVLAQAQDAAVPLLERVTFLMIFASNLDEFFMKRIGLLKRQVEAGIDAKTPDGRTPAEALAALRAMVIEMQQVQANCLTSDILPALAKEGIRLVDYADLSAEQRAHLDNWFMENVYPVLTPLAVDSGHRFPFISNLSESLGIVLSQPETSERVFARVKIPDVIQRLVEAPAGPGETLFVPLQAIMKNNLDDLFPGLKVEEAVAFRVTRNAALEREDDPDDLLISVEEELKHRKFANAVRLETAETPSTTLADFLLRSLGLSRDDFFDRGGMLEYADLKQITDLNLPDHKWPHWRPVVPPRLSDDEADIFDVIRQRDVLVHHPYESFGASVERFIGQAARDPDVLAIKQTLYRTGRDSPFVGSLIRAAEAGKQVACLVEVRARFDEHRNVRFARILEKNGVHVTYGVVGLKTHCKCSLVVRREGPGVRCYAHFGTGNYHPGTAQLYTDLGLLTADPVLTQDAVTLFNQLTGRSLSPQYKELIVAPSYMRDRVVAFIDKEIESAKAGRPARVFAKMNSLEDRVVTNKLYEASQAGVPITLVVRGFCCLRPGVPGLSENIKVMSIVGRFLEHSRIWHFAQGAEDPIEGAWYISSADWMYRNLSNRVETSCPVKNPELRTRLKECVEIMLADRVHAWDMNPDGTYTKRTPREGDVGIFETFMNVTMRG
jgi:polyphosphate kinase